MSIIDQTKAALALMERGITPQFGEITGRPNDPTPLYWRTAMAENYVPGSIPYKWAQAAMQAGAPVARLPIPARPLSYQARARTTDPQTSHEAAASVRKITDTHKRLLTLLRDVRHPGGMTDEQMFKVWSEYPDDMWPPISPSGLRSRRSELVRMGKIVDSGERGTTASGRASIIWKLADG